MNPVFWNRCTLFDVAFQPLKMSVEELERGFRDLVRDIYSDGKVAKRKAKFQQCARIAKRAHA